MTAYRCRKCRQNLDVHNAIIKAIADCADGSFGLTTVLYLDVDVCPQWIVDALIQASWIKGKLVCVKCKGRLGSFDFVKQKLCHCKQHTLPAVHLLKDRIDEVQKRYIAPCNTGHSKIDNVHNNLSDTTDGRSRTGEIHSLDNDASSSTNGAECGATSESVNTMQRLECDNPNIAEQNSAIETVNTPGSLEWDNLMLNDEHQVHSFDDLDEFVNDTVEGNSRSINPDAGPNSNVFTEPGGLGYNKFAVLSVGVVDAGDKGQTTVCTVVETEEEEVAVPSELTCAVCLEIFLRPHRCDPCGHMFCEHCLRQVCRQTPTVTPCPLCREVIYKCVLQADLTESIKLNFEKHIKVRHHETRKKRGDSYPLPGCTQHQYKRFRQKQGHQTRTGVPLSNRGEQIVIMKSCMQELLVRLAWLLLLFAVHSVLFRLDTWLQWDVYARKAAHFNQYLLTLTSKLVLFGVIYMIKKYFRINMENAFVGQSVLFVFIFSVLWDSDSWIQFMINMVVLGSLFL